LPKNYSLKKKNSEKIGKTKLQKMATARGGQNENFLSLRVLPLTITTPKLFNSG